MRARRGEMGSYYILKDGEPVEASGRDWSNWFETADEERRVAVDEIGDVRVSTVFLGLDHGGDVDRPLIYETMTFGELIDHCNAA